MGSQITLRAVALAVLACIALSGAEAASKRANAGPLSRRAAPAPPKWAKQYEVLYHM